MPKEYFLIYECVIRMLLQSPPVFSVEHIATTGWSFYVTDNCKKYNQKTCLVYKQRILSELKAIIFDLRIWSLSVYGIGASKIYSFTWSVEHYISIIHRHMHALPWFFSPLSERASSEQWTAELFSADTSSQTWRPRCPSSTVSVKPTAQLHRPWIGPWSSLAY